MRNSSRQFGGNVNLNNVLMVVGGVVVGIGASFTGLGGEFLIVPRSYSSAWRGIFSSRSELCGTGIRVKRKGLRVKPIGNSNPRWFDISVQVLTLDSSLFTLHS